MTTELVACVQTLTSACGHHCGVRTETDTRVVGHCGCDECHDGPVPPVSITRVGGR